MSVFPAEEYLSFAFQRCHRSSKQNKRLVLIYLLPVKMLLVRIDICYNLFKVVPLSSRLPLMSVLNLTDTEKDVILKDMWLKVRVLTVDNS